MPLLDQIQAFFLISQGLSQAVVVAFAVGYLAMVLAQTWRGYMLALAVVLLVFLVLHFGLAYWFNRGAADVATSPAAQFFLVGSIYGTVCAVGAALGAIVRAVTLALRRHLPLPVKILLHVVGFVAPLGLYIWAALRA